MRLERLKPLLPAALLLPVGAEAHSFGRLYNLPVPFWMYLYGAAAALFLSFLVAGWFVTLRHVPAASSAGRDVSLPRLLRSPLPAQVLGVCVLLLTIVAGLVGNPDPYRNLSMTLLWVVFVLGLAYLCALCGDLYARLNPWRALVDWGERLRPGLFAGRLRYPAALASWPAVALYLGFIWLELFGHPRPHSLAIGLGLYTLLNLLGAWLVGAGAWFRHCEFFSPYFALLGRMAPLEWRVADDGSASGRWRPPFVGVLREPVADLSVLVLILAMLASTAFDGVHETALWVQFFWQDVYRGVLQSWLGDNMAAAWPTLQRLYLAWQSAALLLAPFLYLALYVLFVWLARLVVRAQQPLRELLLAFAGTLLPIALVYNVSHYVTLLLLQGAQLPRLLSDPFGRGWNLFGTGRWIINPALDPGAIWHAQVTLIVAGHIVSVWLAHLEALRLFPDRRRAMLSQLPMLLLMMALTSIGLWILSLPLQAGQGF